MTETTYLDRLELSDGPALREILAYASDDPCSDPNCNCVSCQAASLLQKLWPDATPIMSVEEAVRIFELDLLGDERRYWEENGRARKSHYVAMVTLLNAAISWDEMNRTEPPAPKPVPECQIPFSELMKRDGLQNL